MWETSLLPILIVIKTRPERALALIVAKEEGVLIAWFLRRKEGTPIRSVIERKDLVPWLVIQPSVKQGIEDRRNEGNENERKAPAKPTQPRIIPMFAIEVEDEVEREANRDNPHHQKENKRLPRLPVRSRMQKPLESILNEITQVGHGQSRNDGILRGL